MGNNSGLVRFLQISLCVAVISMPIHTLICNLALVLSFVLSLIIFLREKKFYLVISGLPIIIFIFYVLSITYSENLSWAVRALELGSSFLFIPLIFCFAKFVFTSKFIERLLSLFLASVLLVCTISYVRIVVMTGEFFPSNAIREFTYHEAFSRYAFSEFIGIHPTYLSMYILFAVVVLFTKTRISNILIFALVAIFAMFLFILSSKNQMIVFLILIVVLFWRHLKFSAAIKGGVIIAILSLLGFLGGTNNQIKYRFSSELVNGNGDRIDLLRSAKEVIAEHWFIGVGIGDRNDEMNKKLIKRERTDLINYNAHNQFLDYMLTFGALGLIGLLTIFFIPINKEMDNTFALFLLIIACASLTESIFFRQKGLSFFLFFYGLLGVSGDLTNPFARILRNKLWTKLKIEQNG
jgi:O-antigen ligase